MKYLAVIAAIISAPAFANGYTYDWQTGNSYTTTNNYDGSTTVRGYNYQTGSQWNTTIQPNGNMRGQDSNYNQWEYNNNTGNYYNYGTGKSCYGKGYARTCY